jgi:hypothetical protein
MAVDPKRVLLPTIRRAQMKLLGLLLSPCQHSRRWVANPPASERADATSSRQHRGLPPRRGELDISDQWWDAGKMP